MTRCCDIDKEYFDGHKGWWLYYQNVGVPEVQQIERPNEALITAYHASFAKMTDWEREMCDQQPRPFPLTLPGQTGWHSGAWSNLELEPFIDEFK